MFRKFVGGSPKSDSTLSTGKARLATRRLKGGIAAGLGAALIATLGLSSAQYAVANGMTGYDYSRYSSIVRDTDTPLDCTELAYPFEFPLEPGRTGMSLPVGAIDDIEAMQPGECVRFQVHLAAYNDNETLVDKAALEQHDKSNGGETVPTSFEIGVVGSDGQLLEFGNLIVPPAGLDVILWIGLPNGGTPLPLYHYLIVYFDVEAPSDGGHLIVTKYAGTSELGFFENMGQPHDWSGGGEPPRIPGVEFTVTVIFGFCPVAKPTPYVAGEVEDWCPEWVGIQDTFGGESAIDDFFEAVAKFHDLDPELQQYAVEMNRTLMAVELKAVTDENGEVGTPSNPWILYQDEVPFAAQFDLPPYYLFYVQETYTPGGVDPGIPFFVSIPMLGFDGEPIFDVYAYPKNETVKIVKDVIDPMNCPMPGNPSAPNTLAAEADPANCAVIYDPITHYSQRLGDKVGDDIYFRISVDIPTMTTGQIIDTFGITDLIDPRLEVDPESLRLTFAGDDAAEYYDEWEIDEQYELIYSDDLNVVVMHIVDNTYLETQRHSSTAGTLQLVITFKARALTQGEISNIAYYQINDVIITSNEVKLAFGGKTLWKYDANCAKRRFAQDESWDVGLEREITDYTFEESLERAFSLPATFGTAANECRIALSDATFALFASQEIAQEWSNKFGGASIEPSGSALAFYDLSAVPTDADDAGNYLPTDSLDCADNDGTIAGCPWFMVTSAVDGHANIGGLAYGSYWAVEYSAPLGYSRIVTPIQVDIVEPMDLVYFDDVYCDMHPGSNQKLLCYSREPFALFTATRQDDQLVSNALKNAGFPFPITGGASSVIYAVIAGVIVAGTLYITRRQRKPATV